MSESTKNLTSRRHLGVQMVAGAAAVIAVSSSAEGAQPHMQAALRALNTAQEQLSAAEPDKGGHREKAMGLIRDAINQVQEGIRAGAGR